MSERTKSLRVGFTEVFDVLAVERAYQDIDINPNVTGTVGDELILLRAYLRDAEDTFKTSFGDDHEAPTMDVIRKLAAICIRCMQNHGAVPRAIKTPKLVWKVCSKCWGKRKIAHYYTKTSYEWITCDECGGLGLVEECSGIEE